MGSCCSKYGMCLRCGTCPGCSKCCRRRQSCRRNPMISPDTASDITRELEEYNWELIRSSWDKYMVDLDENAFVVFNRLLKKRPVYEDLFGTKGMSMEEIKKDSILMQHAVQLAYFIFAMVEHANEPEKLQGLLEQIKGYLNRMEFPGQLIVDYKDCTITHMRKKGITSREGAKAWHRFLDNLFKPLSSIK